MSRDYRFILLDASKEAITEVGLVCLNDDDALVVASHVAPRNDVEVWEAERFVGLVPSPYPKVPTAPQPTPVAPVVIQSAPVAPVAVAASVSAPVLPTPVAPPAAAPEPAPAAMAAPPPLVWDDPSKPFNPFRRGSWRRRTQS
jgi:hypothetical protein